MSKRSSNFKSNSHSKGKGFGPNSGDFGKKVTRDVGGNIGGSRYFISDQMKRDISNLNWDYPIGFANDNIYDTTNSLVTYSEPLIQTFDVQPTLGISTNVNSAAHLQALTSYNYTVRINSNDTSYDPVDFEQVYFAMSSVYSSITWAGRILQCVNAYSAENRAIPDLLLEACQVDVEDIRDHITDYRAELNLCIYRTGTLAIPKGIPYFDNALQLYGNIYADENSTKAQLYMFRPLCFYQYDEIGSQEGGRLIPVPIAYQLRKGTIDDVLNQEVSVSTPTPWVNRQPLKWKDIINLINGLLDPLLNSETVGKMCSDIRNAYGAANLVTLPMIPENATIAPLHDYKMLQCIENMKIIPQMSYYSPASETSGSPDSINSLYFPIISQDPEINKGNLVFTYNTPRGTYVSQSKDNTVASSMYDTIMCQDKTLNWHGDEQITNDDVVELCRFIPVLEVDGDVLNVVECGTELIVNSTFYLYSYNNETNVRKTSTVSAFKYANLCIENADNSMAGWLQNISYWTEYNYQPECNMIVSRGDQPLSASRAQLYDLDRSTTISNATLRRIHVNVLLAQFRTPGYESSVR